MMLVGLYTTGRDELKLREDRRKYTRSEAILGAAGANYLNGADRAAGRYQLLLRGTGEVGCRMA